MGQEPIVMPPKGDVFYTEKVQAKLGFGFPTALGDNYLSNSYDLNNSWLFEGRVFIHQKWAFGIQFLTFEGMVINSEALGFYEETRFNLSNAHMVFYPGDREKKLNLGLLAGLGWVNQKNRADFRVFNDTGFSLFIGAETTWRLSDIIGVYLQVQHIVNFMNIDAPAALENQFRTTQMFMPSFGIKVYVY